MPSAPAVDTTYQEAFAVGAGSDSIVYNPPLRALWVGTAGAGGTTTVITAAGQTVTFNSVAAGTLLPIQAATVKATGTTNSNMVGLR